MFYLDDFLWAIFAYVSYGVGLMSMITFVIAVLLQQLFMRLPQNLKNKYKCQWAVVTGSSSGIGKAIAEKLASQGINVVLVALDDQLLENTFGELQKNYPACTFRKVGCNLAEPNYGYMKAIIASTEDIEVNLLFNNAGYIGPGFFAETELERLRCNLECNAGCSVPITHHFLRLMMARREKGLITFTSSAAAYLPGPTATLYSPSKAFVTNFATTLAAEVKSCGIDVVVMHPSPVNTNFYKTEGPKLASLSSAQKGATTPMVIADQIFASAGRLTVWDQGAVAAGFRMANKILDWQIFAEVVTRFAWLNGDHKKLTDASTLRGSKSKFD